MIYYIVNFIDLTKQKDLIMSNNGIPAQADTIESVESLKAKLEQAQKEALTAEERRRNTQSSYTKGQQRIKALEAEIAVLREEAQKAASLSASTDQTLIDLEGNHDAWYMQRQKLESEHLQKIQNRIQEASVKASQEEILAQRMQYLQDFNTANPDAGLTDEFLTMDIPHRLRLELEQTGDFETFINKAYEWKKSGKVIGSASVAPVNQPNLGNIGGAHAPDDKSKADDLVARFKDMIF